MSDQRQDIIAKIESVESTALERDLTLAEDRRALAREQGGGTPIAEKAKLIGQTFNTGPADQDTITLGEYALLQMGVSSNAIDKEMAGGMGRFIHQTQLQDMDGVRDLLKKVGVDIEENELNTLVRDIRESTSDYLRDIGPSLRDQIIPSDGSVLSEPEIPQGVMEPGPK